MAITIQFDTLKDMQKFLDGLDVNVTTSTKRGKKKTTGRKPKKTTTKATKAGKRPVGRPKKKTTAKAAKSTTKRSVGRPKKATTAKTPKTKVKKTTAKKANTKVTKAKAKGKAKVKSAAKKPAVKRIGPTLTSKIQDSINKFIGTKTQFTANDVFDDLAKRDKDIKKQSVITSVLKQMNTNYKNITVSEKAGQGPRPVKVYIPA